MNAETLKTRILAQDMESVHHHAGSVWPELEGSHIFLTGGTGFFGKWLLHSIKHVIESEDFNIKITVLTRNPELFCNAEPALYAFENFSFITGDIQTFEVPNLDFTHLIHSAADSGDHVLRTDPIRMFESIVGGAQRVLEFARRCRVKRLLWVSSGAVYGVPTDPKDEFSEDWGGQGVNCLEVSSAYTVAKRAGEMLCTLYQNQWGVDVSIARCFTFVGPYLPLTVNYAIGNFINDALEGRKITIKGSGQEVRSYLYASDLAVWLWSLLVFGQKGSVINVGSDEAVSIYQVAEEVVKVLSGKGIIVQNIPPTKKVIPRYVPSIERAKFDYGLRSTVDLSEAIRRTAITNGWKST